MTQQKNISDKKIVASEWPRAIIKPEELMISLRKKTKQICLMKSPIYSKLVLQIVGSWAYLLAHVLNKSKVYNQATFNHELRRIELQNGDNRKATLSGSASNGQAAPLMTLSNHISCIDDPILWASLWPFWYYTTNTHSIRWSAAAVDICFAKKWHSTFFSLGKTFPIMRGVGLNQPGMDFASGLLDYNQWLHLFPEGRVMRNDNRQRISNVEKGYIFKWGAAKLILNYFKSSPSDSKVDKTLRILPFYHLGLDEILPIGWPYIPRIGKQITINFRPSVIEMNLKMLSDILKNRTIHNRAIMKSTTEDAIKRIKLTNFLEEEVERLVAPTEKLHCKK